MKRINWNEVEEVKEYERPSAGGYVCRITAVHDEAEKEYLKVEYDIAEGEHAGYFRRLYENRGFWAGSFLKSYKEKALPFFKGFLTAVAKSNPGFQFEDDENRLRGMLIGLVLGEEEYRGNDGTVKKRLYVDQIRSVNGIRGGEWELPDLKRLTETGDGGLRADTDGRLPF